MAVLLVSMQFTCVGTRLMPAAPKARRRHVLLLSNSADIPAGDKPPRYSLQADIPWVTSPRATALSRSAPQSRSRHRIRRRPFLVVVDARVDLKFPQVAYHLGQAARAGIQKLATFLSSRYRGIATHAGLRKRAPIRHCRHVVGVGMAPRDQIIPPAQAHRQIGRNLRCRLIHIDVVRIDGEVEACFQLAAVGHAAVRRVAQFCHHACAPRRCPSG